MWEKKYLYIYTAIEKKSSVNFKICKLRPELRISKMVYVITYMFWRVHKFELATSCAIK